MFRFTMTLFAFLLSSFIEKILITFAWGKSLITHYTMKSLVLQCWYCTIDAFFNNRWTFQKNLIKSDAWRDYTLADFFFRLQALKINLHARVCASLLHYFNFISINRSPSTGIKHIWRIFEIPNSEVVVR